MKFAERRCRLALALWFLLGCVISTAQAGGVEPATRPAVVKVAAIQCSSDLGAVEQNRMKLTALVEEAAAKGAKIIVLPEAAVTGYLAKAKNGADRMIDLKLARTGRAISGGGPQAVSATRRSVTFIIILLE